MKISRIAAGLLSLGITCGSAMAATVGYTEGKRDTVVGTVMIGGDAVGAAPGFDLGAGNTLGTGARELSQIDIFGRIVNKKDTFSFSATSGFQVSFIFGGYETTAGSVAESGFVARPGRLNTSLFSLTGSAPLSFTTDVTGGSDLIFSGGAGDYIFSINGSGGAALYDVTILAISDIAVVPLPASGLLLLFAVGGFGLARKRRKPA